MYKLSITAYQASKAICNFILEKLLLKFPDFASAQLYYIKGTIIGPLILWRITVNTVVRLHSSPACCPRLPLAVPANKPVSVSVILSRSFGDSRLLTQSAIGQLCPGLSPPPSPPPPPWPRLWSCKGIENQNPNRVVSVTYIKGQFRFGAAALYNWNLRHKNLFVPQRQTSERRRWG